MKIDSGAVVGEPLADLSQTGQTTPAAVFLRGERLGMGDVAAV